MCDGSGFVDISLAKEQCDARVVACNLLGIERIVGLFYAISGFFQNQEALKKINQ